MWRSRPATRTWSRRTCASAWVWESWHGSRSIRPPTRDLVVLDAAHLFEGHTTWIGFRRGALLRAYMYEFIELLAPHLPRKLVREAEKAETQEDVERALGALTLPLRE
jgi:hypothetical protein